MIWLNPAALVAFAALAGPILIHFLVQRRAEPFPFPTLRFLQPTRLAAIRRHVLDDVPLLALRAAALAAGAAAVAGPLLVTPGRRQAWERRIVRATVIDTTAQDIARAGDPGRLALHAHQEFSTSSLSDGVRRAIAWLEIAPPARRELVVRSSFPLGSITGADVAELPAGIGLRFERSGTLPAIRTVQAGRVWTSAGVVTREVTLASSRTSVHDDARVEALSWPIDIVSSPSVRSIADAAVSAVRSQRVWAAPPDRGARLVLWERASEAGAAQVDAIADASPIAQPWMADAVARMTRDTDLRAAAQRLAGGLGDPRFARAPWHVVATAADGGPVVLAAASPTRLVLVCGAPASDVVTPLLVRAIANAIAQVPDLQSAEVAPIADAVLQGWSRPAAKPAPGVGAVENDDRRWFWLGALCLLALEMWIRRSRVTTIDPAGADVPAGPYGEREEGACVA
jgi:aerotolerance regulator-like protein